MFRRSFALLFVFPVLGACDLDFGGCEVAPWETGEWDTAGEAWMSVYPGTLAQGETVIVNVTGSTDYDFSRARRLVVQGDVDVLAISPQYNALIATIRARDGAALGPVDLVVEFESGVAAWLDDALTVTPGVPAADDPDDGGDSGDGSGDGGSDSGDGSDCGCP